MIKPVCAGNMLCCTISYIIIVYNCVGVSGCGCWYDTFLYELSSRVELPVWNSISVPKSNLIPSNHWESVKY